VKLLLDTHAFIWWSSEPEKLSKKVLAAFEESGNELTLSVASIWEMQIKVQLGKLDITDPFPAENKKNSHPNVSHPGVIVNHPPPNV
jgi:PIN domain nuclease of toxin-antitoxin system